MVLNESEANNALPPQWRRETLRDLASDMFGGGTPSTKRPEFWDGKYPWTTTAIIKDDDIYLNHFQRSITDEGIANSSTRIAPRGCVLIGTRVGVGKAVVTAFDIAINQDITVLVPTTEVIPEYLALSLKQHSIQKWFAENKRGSTIKGVPRGDVEGIEILLPSLPEQRVIAHVLRTVQRAKEVTEKVVDAAKKLKQSLMQHLFTYGTIPFEYIGEAQLIDTDIGPSLSKWNKDLLGSFITLQRGFDLPKQNRVFRVCCA